MSTCSPLKSSDPFRPQSRSRSCLYVLHQPISIDFLRKRNPKYLYCKPFHLIPNSGVQDAPLNRSVRTIKFMKDLKNLKSIISFKEYARFIKHHCHEINSNKVFHKREKEAACAKTICKKFKNLRSFNFEFDQLCYCWIKYCCSKLVSLSFFIQPNSFNIELFLKFYSKIARRLASIQHVVFSIEEKQLTNQNLKQVLEITRTITSLKGVHLKYRQRPSSDSSDLSAATTEIFNCKEMSCDSITCLVPIPDPCSLMSILKSEHLLRNLCELVLKIPFLGNPKFQQFNCTFLSRLQHFRNLVNLTIDLEFNHQQSGPTFQNLKFPKTLKILNLHFEDLDYKTLFENNKQSLKDFFEDFKQLELSELKFNASVNNSYTATYCNFLRPLLLSQKSTLKVLKFRYTFSTVIQKLVEKNYLHIYEILRDIKQLEALCKLDAYYEILDYTPQNPARSLTHENLNSIKLNVQEIVVQGSPSKGFVEQTLQCFLMCKNLQNINLKCRISHINEHVKRSLNILKKFEHANKIDLEWFTNSVQIEDICNFIEKRNKLININFAFNQTILTKDEVNKLRQSINKTPSICNFKFCSMFCDAVKSGLYGKLFILGRTLEP